MATPVLFENAALLDVARGERRSGTSVLVEGDRIVEVSEGSLRAPRRASHRRRRPHA